MRATCDVCCEEYNASTRKKTACPYCPYEVCTACASRYLLDTTEDPHCMSCRRGWSREILVSNFTQKFVSQTYKTRRENILLERERSLMPATQPYVEMEIKVRKLTQEIARHKFELEKIWEKYHTLDRAPVTVIMTEQDLTRGEARVWIHRRLTDYRLKITNFQYEISHCEWHQKYLMGMIFGEDQLDFERRKFVRACPYAECKGFLSTAWRCGVCENWTCPECHEGRGPNKEGAHTCDPNNIETAKLLARDSRPCPKCASMIFKIDGCDQMYCTQCHTAFSWRTGRVETGTIHNPHYYEFQRARGTLPRNPGDMPCGGYPTWNEIWPILPRSNIFYTAISNAYRSYHHIQHVVLPRYNVDVRNDNRDLRIKFMLNDLAEEEFKKKIQQREKARQRKTDIRQVIQMLTAVLTDLFQTFVATRNVDELMDSLEELKTHYNTTLTAVSKRYTNCAVPRLTDHFDII
jgi:hypothetical protein